MDKGIIVITKKDMVDEEWLMLVEEEIREYAGKSILKGCPIVPVSALSKDGIPELLKTIEEVAAEVVEKPAFGHARLPIDRVFSISGFGTVVTGTLWSGQINVGDTLELMPVKRAVKIRTLQVHNEKVPTAYAGQRVAVNLQGIEVNDIKRGYLLASSGYLEPSYRVNTRLRLLSSSARTLKNWNRIRFHLGTDETLGRVVLLDRDELLPGEEAYAQIVMEKPVVAYKGDPFVIRYYSPVNTIGGGTIIDPNAPRQKRFKEEVLNELAVKEEGSLYDIVLHELESSGPEPLTIQDIAKRTGSTESHIQEEIQQLIDDEKVIDTSGKGMTYFSSLGVQQMSATMSATIQDYLQKYPLRQGYPKEDMRSRFFNKLNPKVFTGLLRYFEDNGILQSRNNLITLPGYQASPGEKEARMIAEIMRQLQANEFNPPAFEEMEALKALTENDRNEIISYLAESGEIIKIIDNMYFSAAAIEHGKEMLADYFSKEKELSLATARDLFNTSRKYALPLIEYYDRIRFTRRVGDIRIKA